MPTLELWKNNAASALAAPIGPGDLTITVASGHGARFPSPTGGDWFWVTLDSGSLIEICKCTSRSGDTLTVVRGQQGTSASSFVSAAVENRVTKSTLERFLPSVDPSVTGTLTSSGKILTSVTGGADGGFAFTGLQHGFVASTTGAIGDNAYTAFGVYDVASGLWGTRINKNSDVQINTTLNAVTALSITAQTGQIWQQMLTSSGATINFSIWDGGNFTTYWSTSSYQRVGAGRWELSGEHRITHDSVVGAQTSTRVLQRTVGTTVGDTTDVGAWTFNNGAGFLEITLTSQVSNYSSAAKYQIPVQYHNGEQGYGGTWLRALPISFSGTYGGNLVEIDTRITQGTLDVRLRRVSGSNNATHTLTCTDYGQSTTFTASTATATGVAAPTITSSGTYLTQRANRVGVGTNAPAYTFDVTGDIRATGSILAHGNTVASADDLTVTASAGALYLDSTVSNDIIFRPGDAWTVAMRVSPGGIAKVTSLLGVAVTPLYPLHVSGVGYWQDGSDYITINPGGSTITIFDNGVESLTFGVVGGAGTVNRSWQVNSTQITINPTTPASQSAILSLYRGGYSEWTIANAPGNTLDFRVGGGLKMQIAVDGNVGIGGAPDASYHLKVHGDSGAKFMVYGGDSNNSYFSSYTGSGINLVTGVVAGRGCIGTWSPHAIDVRIDTGVVATWDTTGNLQLGTTTTFGGAYNRLTVLGAVVSSTSATNSTDKSGWFLGAHYTNAEEAVTGLYTYSSAGGNTVCIGGGSGSYNAATLISFYTAANGTTTTGTRAGYISDNGGLYWEHSVYSSGTNAAYYFYQRDNLARGWALYATGDAAHIWNGAANILSVGYYGDLSQVRDLTMSRNLSVSGRLSGANIIESGYVEGNPVNFRFDQDCLRYVTRWGTATITTTGGVTTNEVDSLTAGQTGSLNLYGKSDPCSIEITGISINNSDHTAFFPYVFLHANNNPLTVKMEVKKGAGAWEVLYDGATEGTVIDYHIAKVTSTGAALTGVRWTFSNILNPTYLRRIGCIAVNGEAYQDTLLKSGGTLYGNVTIASGYTLNLANLTASQAVLTDGSKNLVSVAYTGSANVVRSTSAAMLTPSITNATLVGGYFGGQPMFTSGCNSAGGDAGAGLYQVAFSYAGQDTYKHFLRTRHNGGDTAGNAIDFFTCGGTSGGAIGSAVLGLTIEAGQIKLGTGSAILANAATNFNERVGLGSNNGWPSMTLWSSAGATGFTIYDADVWKVGSLNGHDVAFIVNSVERMRIDTSGKFGLGTSAPLWQLTLTHATASEIALMNGSNVGATFAMIHAANAAYLSTNSTFDLVFQTNAVERMRIKSTGEVGIGCTPSSSKTLSVGGDIAVGYRTTPDDTYACWFLLGTPYHLADGHWYPIGFNSNNGSNNLLLGWNKTTSISLASDTSTTAGAPRVVATITYNGMTIDNGTFGIAGLTASQGVLTDGSKNLVSVALTGTGSLVRGTSPTIATPSLVDGNADVQLSIGTGYVSVENEIRFGGVSYSRLSYDVGNGAPWLGYNCKLVGSAFKHDSTGTLGGIRFTANGDIFFYTNVSAAANTTVTPQVSIDAAGVVGITALTASKLVATNVSKQLVSYDLVATDIPALTSSNAIQAAKGHRFWMHCAASDLGSAITQLIIPVGGIDSITYPTPLPRACKLVRIAITAMHADSTTPPSTWTVDVYKNGSSASTMSFNLNASPFVDTTTSGNTSSTINFSADDTIGIKLTGTSLDALVARMSLEFETTS